MSEDRRSDREENREDGAGLPPPKGGAPSEEPPVDLSLDFPAWMANPPRLPADRSTAADREDPFYVDPAESFHTFPLDRSLPDAASEPVLPRSVLDPGDDWELPGRGAENAQPAQQDWDFDGAPGESDEETSPELAEVRILAQALAKAVKASRLYPIDNPVCHRFAQDLLRSFASTFELMDEVRLAVGKTKFFFRGELVLDQPGREESVPGRFFWDGIREITFHAGLSAQEVYDFLAMCRRVQETEEGGEDDLVTLFWQRQFEHVAYIAVDDILDLENPDDPVPEEFGTEFMNFVDLEMHDLDDEEEIYKVGSEFAEEIRERLRGDDVDLFGVDPEARRVLLGELKEEDSPKMLEDVLQIIFETLFLDGNEGSFIETVRVIAGAQALLVSDGRILLAAGLLRMLAELRDQREDLTERMRAEVQAGIDAGWTEASCEALVQHLNQNLPDVLHGLGDFIGLLPDNAIASLVHVLSRLDSPRARRTLVESLTRRARLNVDEFIPYLQDPRPEMVRDVAFILAGTGSDRVVKPLRAAMKHPDVAVRCQILEALTQLGPAKSGDVLFAAIFDADSRVRLAAIRSLGQAGRIALPTLVLGLEDKRFDERDFVERKAYFRALGAAGGHEVLPLIEPMLKQRSLFRRGFSDEQRACACEALGWIGGPRSLELLRGVENDRSTMVRSAAQAALRRLAGGEDAGKDAA